MFLVVYRVSRRPPYPAPIYRGPSRSVEIGPSHPEKFESIVLALLASGEERILQSQTRIVTVIELSGDVSGPPYAPSPSLSELLGYQSITRTQGNDGLPPRYNTTVILHPYTFKAAYTDNTTISVCGNTVIRTLYNIAIDWPIQGAREIWRPPSPPRLMAGGRSVVPPSLVH